MESPLKRRRISRDKSPGAELYQQRLRNDLRLKSTFESIFEKYSKDFSGIGDEIDFKTGKIVVDHGHVIGMKNETDPGCVEDLYDELDPEYWACKDESKLSSKNRPETRPLVISQSLPQERPAVDPAWYAPPLPKHAMPVQKMASTHPLSMNQLEKDRSPSPTGTSLWAFNQSGIQFKKSKQTHNALPSHAECPETLPNSKMKNTVSATDGASINSILVQAAPEQIPRKLTSLTPLVSSARSKSTATLVWTSEDDQLLRALKFKSKRSYADLVIHFPKRKRDDIRNRWLYLRSQNCDPLNVEDSLHRNLNKSPAILYCDYDHREIDVSLLSSDKSCASEPRQSHCSLELSEAPQEPARMIQSKALSPQKSRAHQPLKKPRPGSSKLFNDLKTVSSVRSTDKKLEQIEPLGGHFNDTLGNEKTIAPKKTASKSRAHPKPIRSSSTLPDHTPGISTSSSPPPDESAKPVELLISKDASRKAGRLQITSCQNLTESRSPSTPAVKPLPHKRKVLLRRPKIRGEVLGSTPNIAIEISSDSSDSNVTSDTPHTANKELANDFWEPPMELDSPRGKMSTKLRKCSNCSTKNTLEWSGKLCSDCYQYKNRTRVNRPALLNETPKCPDRHENGQKRKTDNETKTPYVSPLPSIVTSQAGLKNNRVLPNQSPDIPRTPSFIIDRARFLALEDISEDELSMPVKTVGTQIAMSLPQKTKLKSQIASHSHRRVL